MEKDKETSKNEDKETSNNFLYTSQRKKENRARNIRASKFEAMEPGEVRKGQIIAYY